MPQGTEPTPGARAQEAARLIAQFLGDLCVVACAPEDRRSFGPFVVESRNGAMTALTRQAVETAAMDAYLARFGMSAMAFVRAAGRRTIAELVPDEETLDLLTALGVAQGFHVGRPRPLEEL